MTTQSTPRLSSRVAALQPSATLAMIQRVRGLQNEGIPVLDLTAGEPDFPPPTAAEEAGIQAIQEGKGRYTPAAGLMELRKAAADHIEKDFGLSYRPQEVVITHGAKIGIAQALMAFGEVGRNVLVPYPCWTSYPEMVRLAEAEPVMVRCDAQQLPTVDELEKSRDENTVALLLNTPCNPTGVVFPEDRLREIGQWALDHKIIVISDEIYGTLVYGDAEHISPLSLIPELKETSVWIGGMSKAYAMTGWRIGFVAAAEPLAEKIGAIQSQLAGSPCAISQWASLAALQQGDEARETMRASFEVRRELLVQELNQIPGLSCTMPQGAFYAFPNIQSYLGKTDQDSGRKVHTGDDLVEILLEQDHIALIGGAAFGDPNSVRISFAASADVLTEALKRFRMRLSKLQ
ncbi:MAG: pyridoxal phosphate-dependent aminotransferase [Planctomycetota bacterium]|nr:pyridoxal phosphate-dependent aminotransferase [Planctomycetota bacterium]